jgi:putative acetyltransferase
MCGHAAPCYRTAPPPPAPSTFEPALRLYETAGFTRCGPFDGYVLDPFSIFMRRDL